MHVRLGTGLLVSLVALGVALVAAGALSLHSPATTSVQAAFEAESSVLDRSQLPPLFIGTAQTTLPDPVTTITVTTVEDNANVSQSETCAGVVNDPDDSRCTLRRAIVQARNTPADERPVLIRFDLPASESNDPANPEYWVMQITPDTAQSPLGSTTGGQFVGGQIILDGRTQPIGRDPSEGPSVFIPNEGSRFERFVINEDENYVVGIGWMGLRLIVNDSNNVFEQNWFGLQPNGEEIYLFEGDPIRDNNATLEFSEAGGNNTIQNNVFAGARTNAITLRSNNNMVMNNWIGTRGDGTVPNVASNRQCWPNAQFFNWFGGGGIVVSGSDNTVQENTIVALLYASADPTTTPDNAITIEDGNNTIISNTIGIDRAGLEFGVCGRGIVLTDRGNLIEANEIVGAILEGGIGLRGAGAGTVLAENTIRNNIVRDTIQSIYIFPRVTDDYEYFNPAKITSIDGTTVTGESGDPGFRTGLPPIDSTCLGCIVEIFLDDSDVYTESLQSLGTVVSSPDDGTFTFELPAPLQPGQYLRTTSTSVEENQIADYGPGATTKTSEQAYGVDGVLVDPEPLPPPPDQPEPPSFAGLLPVLRDPPPLVLPDVYSTTITVTTSLDYNVSRSETCSSEADEPEDSGCTLRRAILEASRADGPALVQFNIPTSDAGYNSELGVWVIQMSNQVGSDELELGGQQVVIDGLTQPGGRDRSQGPSIFVRGANNFTDIVIRGEGAVVKDLGWQQVELRPSSGDNVFIENNWLGLTEDGQNPYFIGGNPTTDNKSTIELVAGNGHVVRGNVVTGAYDRSIAVRAADNFVVGNWVGTRGDGTVPPPPDGVLYCEQNENAWYAGSGIRVSGSSNQIGGPGDQANIIGSIFLASPAGAVQPPAIETQANQNLVYGNIIGRDGTGAARAVCGEGIRADSGLNIFENNEIYGALVGILSAGIPNQYLGNTIEDSIQATGFTDALQTLRNYDPARITELDGVNVSGTNGDVFIQPATGAVFDPTCPYCTVQLFADNNDEDIEALELLAVTTSDGDGNWTATLSRELAATEGLRTMTVSGDYRSIQQVSAEVGFTTKLSPYLYRPGQLTTPTPTIDPAASPTPTATTDPAASPTMTPTMMISPTMTATPTMSATDVVTGTPTMTSTPTATTDPAASPTPTTDPNASPTPTTDPAASPTPTTDPNASPTPTATTERTTVREETNVSPDTGGTLNVPDDNLRAMVNVPPGAVEEDTTLTYTGLENTNEPLPDNQNMRSRLRLSARDADSGAEITRFTALYTITFDLTSIQNMQLAQDSTDPVAYARNESGEWVRAETLCQLEGCGQSVEGTTLTLTVDYMGEFAVGQANQTQDIERVYLPLVVSPE